jgi:hypothetical protein
MNIPADHETSSYYSDQDELPPFALPEEDGTVPPQHLNCVLQSSPQVSRPHGMEYVGSILSAPSSTSQPPGLASSMLSCPTDESTHSCSIDGLGAITSSMNLEGNTTSFLPGDSFSSQYLDAAASSLAPMAGNPTQTSFSRASDVRCNSDSRASITHTVSQEALSDSFSLGFSQLMQNADNTIETICHSNLPVLPEETEASELSQSEMFHSAQGGLSILTSQAGNFPSPAPSSDISSNWLPLDVLGRVSAAVCSTSNNHCRLSRATQQSMHFTHLKQSRLRNIGVRARQLDTTSFEVSVDLASFCAVKDVIRIVGNPSLLCLWCESIQSLVITSSSEGVRDTVNQHRPSANGFSERAEYEGEWIEAAATELRSPPSMSGCVYRTRKALWNSVGFPSYGKISMFVERQRGRVGLTVGPFAGDVMVSHTITALEDPGQNKLTIVDRVTLARDTSSSELLCGLLECLESCFLPSLKGYMDQVVSSMTRLRVLVESGERRHYEDPRESSYVERSSFHDGERHQVYAFGCAASTPLLP